MKFKDSVKWRKNGADAFGQENAIGLRDTFLTKDKEKIKKVEINIFKNSDREAPMNFVEFNYYSDAINYLDNLELTDIDLIKIYWNNGISVGIGVDSSGFADFYIYNN